MQGHYQNPAGFQAGDKIRIRSGELAGLRGVILAASDELIQIQLNSDQQEIITIQAEAVTNYSLAARRAWEAIPKKAGRPKFKIPKKKMISLRIDLDVSEKLEEAVRQGLIDNKQQAINEWLREKLEILFSEESK